MTNKYRVKGYAFIPVEIEVVQEAENEKAAMEKAKKRFEQNPGQLEEFIVPGSCEEGSVHSFEPNRAEILIESH